MKSIMIAAAVATLVTAPALAQNYTPAPGVGDIQANRPAGRPVHHRGALSAYGAVQSPFAGREESIRECNTIAAKTYAVRDSNWSLSAYRACMAEHGQPE